MSVQFVTKAQAIAALKDQNAVVYITTKKTKEHFLRVSYWMYQSNPNLFDVIDCRKYVFTIFSA